MLGERAAFNFKAASANVERASAHEPMGKDKRRPSSTPRRTVAHESAASQNLKAAIWTDEDSSKLIAFKEGSNEFALQKKVQSILHDSTTPEHNTRQHFASTFVSAGKAMSDLRLFIDGMHEVIST